MFSSEDYYRKCAEAKGNERILMLLHSMRRDIRRLKNKIEKSYISDGEPLSGGEYEELASLRECFEIEKSGYINNGGHYEMSNSEKKSKEFNDKLINIDRLDFEIFDDFSRTLYKRTIVFENDEVWFDCYYDYNNGYAEPMRLRYEGCSKIDFINALEGVAVGEWKSFYSDRKVEGGSRWNLEITYNDYSLSFNSSGMNAWPYNFYALEHLLGIPV